MGPAVEKALCCFVAVCPVPTTKSPSSILTTHTANLSSYCSQTWCWSTVSQRIRTMSTELNICFYYGNSTCKKCIEWFKRQHVTYIDSHWPCNVICYWSVKRSSGAIATNRSKRYRKLTSIRRLAFCHPVILPTFRPYDDHCFKSSLSTIIYSCWLLWN